MESNMQRSWSSHSLLSALVNDPYAVYAEMRRLDQPLFIPHHPGEANRAQGKWLLSTYAQAQAVLADTVHFSKRSADAKGEEAEAGFDDSMLFQDDPDHKRLRHLVEGFFRGKPVSSYAEVVRCSSIELLEVVELNSVIDLVPAYAELLPLSVIARLIGLPQEEIPLLRDLSRRITAASDDLAVNDSSLAAKALAFRQLQQLFQAGLKGAWRPREDSLLEALLDAQEAHLLAGNEAAAMLMLLMFAGHETTIALIGSCLNLLLSNPDQLGLLHANPGLIKGAVDETLRFEAPLQRSTFRMAIDEVAIGAHRFVSGDQVSVILGSANRDEKIFTDADTFQIDRFPNPHLAFGRGSYHCLGRHLAVMEAEVAVQAFLQHFPRARISGEVVWSRNSFIRSLQSLPVLVGA
ncbi:cytochrome P450 [Synechococcus sp. CBW1002]|uniref:cytochrome P450 n=1 Tax=Synechococcus sp. CBW1002 TaxID=1353134 RepID=UPI0018CD4685|nr:cytochrome P450 [Synechococcus sp. CBW1002]QPN60660.1 cytochrome P450 [Synechococcus sp. CBW1002]